MSGVTDTLIFSCSVRSVQMRSTTAVFIKIHKEACLLKALGLRGNDDALTMVCLLYQCQFLPADLAVWQNPDFSSVKLDVIQTRKRHKRKTAFGRGNLPSRPSDLEPL